MAATTTLDFAFGGEPFVTVQIALISTPTLDYAFGGRPFVASESTAITASVTTSQGQTSSSTVILEATATSQGQSAAAAASVSSIATASTEQGQTIAGALSDGSGTFTYQGQSSSAVCGLASAVSVSTSQGQSVDSIIGQVLTGGTMTLTAPSLSGTIQQSFFMDGASIFPELAVSGSLEPPMALNQLTVSATGVTGTVSTGSIRFSALLVDGGIDDGVILEELTVAGTAFEDALIDGDAVLEQYECAGSLEPAMATEELTLSGVILNGAVAEGAITMPTLTVDGSQGTTGDLAFEALTVNADGLSGNVAVGNVVLDKPFVSATHFQGIEIDGGIVMPLHTIYSVMSETGLIVGAVTFIQPTVVAEGVAGSVSSGLISIPLLSVDAAGFFDTVGTATIELPLISLDGWMNQTGVTATYTTVALNTQIRAVSLYEGVAFNSFANFAGVTLAASADGIVALVGGTDLGVNIAAAIAGGVTDFGMRETKQVLTGYVGYRASGDLEVTMITDQHSEYSYTLSPRQDAADLHATRVKFGRGVHGRYWQWRIANVEGADFDIDMLTFDVSPSARRV